MSDGSQGGDAPQDQQQHQQQHGIDHNAAAPPVAIPRGYIGPFVIPGTGRLVWWTGRVAIGLRHQPTRPFAPLTQSASWIQRLMLAGRGKSGRLNRA